MKKAILGLLISALLIYLSVKDTDFQRVIYGMTKMGYGYILPFFIINLILFSGVFFALFRRPLLWKFLNFSLRILPEKWKDTLNRLLHNFLDGFRVIGDGKRLFQIF